MSEIKERMGRKLFQFFILAFFLSVSAGNLGAGVLVDKVVFAVNCGGPGYTDKSGIVYQADTLFSGGQIYKTTASITGTEDGPLYQTERWGRFSYNIPVSNGNYLVTLKFAEIYPYAVAGQRVFQVQAEGNGVVSDLDLVAEVGKTRAYDLAIPVNVKDGMLNLDFYNDQENAKVSAILVQEAIRPASGEVIFAVNCGGSRYVDKTGIVYQADTRFSGGQTYNTKAGVEGAEDHLLYQSERYGNFSYSIPVADGGYFVTLKFAEIYPYAAAGKRVFTVKVGGNKVITNLDLFSRVGKNKVYDVTIPVNVQERVLHMDFYSAQGNAKVSAIVVAEQKTNLTQGGIVTGKVTDSTTNFSLPLANVSITDSSNIPKTGLTDDNGEYKLSEILPGDYQGKVTKDGYEPYEFKGNIVSGQTIPKDVPLERDLPLISKIGVGDITTETAVVTWETDQDADSLVEYGLTTSYGSFEGDSVLIKSRRIPLKNLLPKKTYHYRVTSKNIFGFSSTSDDRTFETLGLTGPITLNITYPGNGDTISKSDVRVEGTVTNSTGNETGVVVNGVLATVVGDQFMVNHIPLLEGENTITAVATDVKGNTGNDTIDVNMVMTQDYIRMTASMESGILPFETVMYLDSSLGLENASLSSNNPSDVEVTGVSENEYKVKIAREGAYVLTARVADPSGVFYDDAITLIVMNKAEVENLLSGKWEGMRGALVSGDIEKALNDFVPGSRDRYGRLFNDLGQEKIQSIFSNVIQIKVYSYSGSFVKGGVLRRESGGVYSYPVTFMQDGNGIWKIMGF